MPDPVIEAQVATQIPDARTVPPEATEEVPPLPDFDTALAALQSHLVKGSPEYDERLAKLRSHSVVAGVAGNIAEQMRKAQDVSASLEAAAAAARAKEQELLDLAENDPEEFAARFRTQAQADRARKEIQELRDAEAARISGQIGQHVRNLPELQELSLPEQRRIADALSKASPDDMLGVYNEVLLDIATDKRTAARVEAQFPERLQAEIEARETASNATRLRTAPAPSLRTGGGGQPTDIPDPVSDPRGYVRWIDSGGRRR